MTKAKTLFLRFLPFWTFVIIFNFAANIHYSLISPLGEKVFPLWLAGILMGGISFIQLFLDVPIGALIDRFGYLRFLKIGNAFFLAAALTLAFGVHRLNFLLSLLFSVAGWLFTGSSTTAYILSKAPVGDTGKSLSMVDSASSLGSVLSASIISVVIGWQVINMSLVMSVLFAGSLIFLFLLPRHEKLQRPKLDKGLKSRHHTIHPVKFGKMLFKEITELNPPAAVLLLHNITSSIFYGIIWFVIPLLIAHSNDFSGKILGIGLGIFDFAIFTLGLILGKLADRFNQVRLTFIGLLVFAISGMLIGFNLNWLFLVFGLIAAIGDELASLALWGWLNKLNTEKDDYGLISGAVGLFGDLGWAIGPAAAGFLYDAFGPHITIAVGAVLVIVSWFAYQLVMLHPKYRRRKNPLEKTV